MYRLVRSDDPEEILDTMAFAFGVPLSGQGDSLRWLRSSLEAGRELYCVRHGGTAVAACLLYPYTMRLRGSLVPMGGLGGVCSRPEWRGRGAVRFMLSQLLLVMREQRRGISVLYPFSAGFYRNHGWEIFAHWQSVVFDPSTVRPRDDELCAEEHRSADAEVQAYYNDYAAAHHNLIQRSPMDWKLRLRPAAESEVCRGLVRFSRRGALEGLLEYVLKQGTEERKPGFVVRQLVPDHSPALGGMLSFLRGLRQQVKRVELTLPPHARLWPHLTERPDKVSLNDGAMIRIVDLASLDGLQVDARGYDVTVEVADPEGPWNQGVWRLREEEGRLRISPGGRAQIRTGIGPLSAVLGGSARLSELAASQDVQVLHGMRPPELPPCEPFMADFF